MRIIHYHSTQDPQFNTQILRSIEQLVCKHRKLLPAGWRAIIELRDYADLQNNGDMSKLQPYYLLDLSSNIGGGDYAPTKLNMLKFSNHRFYTGGDTPDEFCRIIEDFQAHADSASRLPNHFATDLLQQLSHLNSLSELGQEYWCRLKCHDLTHYYGAIRVPYEAMITSHQAPSQLDHPVSTNSLNQAITTELGEVLISFSGATEWEDAFFALSIFKSLQQAINFLFDHDQFWYNLRALEQNPHLAFWIELLDIYEA